MLTIGAVGGKRALCSLEQNPEFDYSRIPQEIWEQIFSHSDPYKAPGLVCCKQWQVFAEARCKELNANNKYLPWDEKNVQVMLSERIIYLTNKVIHEVVNRCLRYEMVDPSLIIQREDSDRDLEAAYAVIKNNVILSESHFFKDVFRIMKHPTYTEFVLGWGGHFKNCTDNSSRLIQLISLYQDVCDLRVKENKTLDDWRIIFKWDEYPSSFEFKTAARQCRDEGELEEAAKYWKQYFLTARQIPKTDEFVEAMDLFISLNKPKEFAQICLRLIKPSILTDNLLLFHSMTQKFAQAGLFEELTALCVKLAKLSSDQPHNQNDHALNGIAGMALGYCSQFNLFEKHLSSKRSLIAKAFQAMNRLHEAEFVFSAKNPPPEKIQEAIDYYSQIGDLESARKI